MIQFGLQSYGQFDSSHGIGPVVWPHYDLLLLHEGEVRLRFLGRESLHLTAGDALLIYPNTSFEGNAVSLQASASVHHFTPQIEDRAEDELSRAVSDFAGKERGFEVYRSRVDAAVQLDADRLIRRSEPNIIKGPASHAMRTALLLLILGQIRGDSAGAPLAGPHSYSEYGELMRWAAGHLEDQLTVADMARQTGMSESHFRKSFAKDTGHTAGRYLRELRITHARRLLRETRLPIKQVAQRVGYSGPIAFHHAFLRQLGVTPSQYRKNQSPRG